jgi:hypothetical protein
MRNGKEESTATAETVALASINASVSVSDLPSTASASDPSISVALYVSLGTSQILCHCHHQGERKWQIQKQRNETCIKN